MTDERARVEAWMREICREIGHGPALNYRNECPNCLLAFAAAQREEEREACARIADWEIYKNIAKTIRARREGQGEQT